MTDTPRCAALASCVSGVGRMHIHPLPTVGVGTGYYSARCERRSDESGATRRTIVPSGRRQ
jgi:hypothetical protein